TYSRRTLRSTATVSAGPTSHFTEVGLPKLTTCGFDAAMPDEINSNTEMKHNPATRILLHKHCLAVLNKVTGHTTVRGRGIHAALVELFDFRPKACLRFVQMCLK